MCTVTYLPSSSKNFILTSNRDESPERNAHQWDEVITHAGEKLFFPKDAKADGTWICSSDYGRAACLLNGAKEPYDFSKEFARSRGQIVLDSFHALSFEEFIRDYVFKGFAPFTLILKDPNLLLQIQWDGIQKSVEVLELTEARIWSAVTLYPPEIRKWRENIFTDWLLQLENWSQEDTLHFHRFGTDWDKINGFVMNRNNLVRTLSITSFAFESSIIVIKHLNLATENLYSKRVPIISSKSFG